MKYRKKNTRRKTYRRRSRKSIKDRVPRKDPRRYADLTFSPSTIADRTMVKLKYMQRIVLSSSSGIQASQVFRGNSLFDPDFTGSGAQPVGFDQWATFYNNYRVRGAKINIQFATAGTTAGSQTWDLCCYPSLSTTVTAQDSSHVQPLAKWKLGNLGSNTKFISSYVSTAKMFGTNKRSIAINDSYGAAIGSNPTNAWFFIICSQPADQSTSGSCFAYVTITYYTEFYDKQNLTLS